MKFKSTGQIARDFGVSTQTVRRWAADGEFENIRYTKGGQLRIGQTPEETIGYARVSSKKQLNSLDEQAKEIKTAYPNVEVVSDVGSGFNFKRRNFVKILERCLRGSAVTVVVSDRDRLARTGFGFIRLVIESHGGSVVSLNQSSDESESFDTENLVGFITSFCNSYYGKRSSRRKKDKDLP